MKRVYLALPKSKAYRYIATAQLPGYVIVNTSAPVEKVLTLHVLSSNSRFKFKDETISRFKKLATQPRVPERSKHHEQKA